MISEIIKTKNAKTLVYYDTPYTKATVLTFKYSAAIDYLKAIENNASDIYIFENQN